MSILERMRRFRIRSKKEPPEERPRKGLWTVNPFQITRTQLEWLFSSPKLVQRMRYAGWIVVTRPGKPGRETLFDYSSAMGAYERLRNGEQPPLLPSERGRLTSNTATKK